MEQAPNPAPPVQVPVLVDEKPENPVLGVPASVASTSHAEKPKAPEADEPVAVVANSNPEEPKAPEADVTAPVAPTADTPGTEMGPNEHEDVEIVRASPARPCRG